MKKWLGTAIVVIVFVALALTYQWWLPPLLGFVGANSNVIQGLESAVQIILWLGAGLALVLGWKRASKQPATTIPESGSSAQGAGASAVGERGVHGEDISGVVVTGDENIVTLQNIQSAKKPNVAALERSYLANLLTQAGQLSLEGIDPKAASEAEKRLSLSAVYTALLTVSPEAHDRLERGEMPQRSEIRRSSALQELNEHKHLVLLGDPGSGKTTFVNFVAMCLAGERLERADVNLKMLTAPLPDDDGDDRDEHQPWQHGPLLPVRVILRDLAASGLLPGAGHSVSVEHLWNFIQKGMKDAGLAAYAPYLRKRLDKQGGIILFDGLDEVPAADERREQIIRLVEQTTSAFPKCRILVTSRVYAYRRQDWALSGFDATVLAPFSRGQIIRFVDRWYAHIGNLRDMSQADAQGRAQLLKHAIFASDRLQALAERPLLLTLMASLHAWRGGSLPEKREQLYNDTVDLLLDWWERRRIVRDADGKVLQILPSLAEFLKVDRERLRQELNRLAYEAHDRQPELVGTADIAEDDLVQALMHIRRDPDLRPNRLVEYLRDRAGLLIPRGVGVYTFPHRTFQEYLAACYLSDEDYPDKVAALAMEEPDRWREVVLLAGAKAARGSQSTIWLLTESLCQHAPPEDEVTTPSAGALWGAYLAGQALLESSDLSRISATNRQKLDRVRHWLPWVIRADEQFTPKARASAGDVLAKLGDPRFRADAWFLPNDPLLGFIEIPAGPFLMGESREQHTVNLPTYYIARYPVTVAQFRAYVEASGNQPGDLDALRDPDTRPVLWVNWHEALSYCDWLTKTLQAWPHTPASLVQRLAQGWRFTLPSEAQWEKAARGTDGSAFPWGNEPNPNKANYDDTGISDTSAAGCFPGGTSPFGVEEMGGNVWEWTRSLWGKGWREPEFMYPYNRVDGRENLDAAAEYLRVVRGGSFNLNELNVRCASRDGSVPNGRGWYLGFRVVFSPSTSEL